MMAIAVGQQGMAAMEALGWIAVVTGEGIATQVVGRMEYWGERGRRRVVGATMEYWEERGRRGVVGTMMEYWEERGRRGAQVVGTKEYWEEGVQGAEHLGKTAGMEGEAEKTEV